MCADREPLLLEEPVDAHRVGFHSFRFAIDGECHCFLCRNKKAGDGHCAYDARGKHCADDPHSPRANRWLHMTSCAAVIGRCGWLTRLVFLALIHIVGAQT